KLAHGIGAPREIDLVQHDDGRNAGMAGRHQSATQQVVGIGGFGGDDHQQLVDIGGELLGAHVVGAVQQVAPVVYLVDGAFVQTLGADVYVVAHGRPGALAPGKTCAQSAVHHFNDVMSAV